MVHRRARPALHHRARRPASAGSQTVLALRRALLACEVPPEQIELTEDDSYSVKLRVRHDLPTSP